MEILEKQTSTHTIKVMRITHRFVNYPNIVCSGKSIIQLPCMIGKRSYNLKTLTQQLHCRMRVYLINSKRVSTKQLRECSYKVEEEFVLEERCDCPF